MKKTLIALMAMASTAFGADYIAETVWTLNFGTEYGSAGYEWVGTPEDMGTMWDVRPVEGGTQTSASKRIHLARGNYGSWDTDFQFSMTLTLDDVTISASNDWPVFAEISSGNNYYNNNTLRFGPYVNENNTVAIDGTAVIKGENNLVSVNPGETYTITLTKIGNEVTVAVNGQISGYGTLADYMTGNITDITLGGNTGSQYRINEVVHSVSWSILTPAPEEPEPSPSVPEPTTATLSLLALAGLAARRRRK